MPIKETCCTHCAHLPVCAFKGYIIGAQEAIDKLTIMTPKAEHEYIHDIDFIKPIYVECTYYMPNTTTRKDRLAKAPPLQGYSRNEVRKD